ncbi:MAG: archease [Candidatus Aenigmatarchaeota archaeon]|nr:MAG: archease [Candidatus Aenigmarchaeota archaeon]
MKYKFIDDLTSDVVFEAYGKGLNELFENAAFALFSVICQVGKIKPEFEKEIEVEGKDVKDLMFNWLQKLIEVVDIDNLFLSKFKVKEIGDTQMKAACYGERADPKKGGTLVKAVTYYKFDLEKTKKGYKVTVSLDI